MTCDNPGVEGDVKDPKPWESGSKSAIAALVTLPC